MEALKEKLKAVWVKLKTVKNIEIIAGLVIIAIMVLIYSTVTSKSAETEAASTETAASETSITDNLESRLASILSEIDGAGDVRIMITYASTAKLVTATDENDYSTSTTNGSSTTSTSTSTSTPVVSGSELIVIEQQMPDIIGVIIVAEGAANIKVRLNLVSAASTALGIKANSIQIFTRRDV